MCLRKSIPVRSAIQMEAVRLLVQLSKPKMNSCLTASHSFSVTVSPVVGPHPCRDMSTGAVSKQDGSSLFPDGFATFFMLAVGNWII